MARSKISTQYRYLSLLHEKRALENRARELEPGEAEFRAFYRPSIEGGLHTITVNQHVDIDPGKEDNDPSKRTKDSKPSKQDFDVVAPRFSLPTAALDSQFPPPGNTALGKTLPQLVLKDQHFPWERKASDRPENVTGDKNRVPWVALIAFTEDELKLGDQERSEILSGVENAIVNETLGFNLPVVQLEKIPGGPTSRLTSISPIEKKENTSVICIQRELYKALFTDINGVGNVTKFKYLSHVRRVATDGMVSASDGEVATFSTVVSHRLGPLDITTPTPVIVHLISLECIDQLPGSMLNARVALVSLYSWTYTALPPGSFDVYTSLQFLGQNKNMLRSERTAAPKLANGGIEDLISQRQDDGYTLIRYRTVTGEETAGIYRGPLVPKKVKHPLRNNFTIQSNFGTDLQILDPKLGLMDLTYATGWQLGKTLALGDPAFTAALARVRGFMHADAIEAAKKDIYLSLGDYTSRDATVGMMADMVSGLEELNSNLHHTGTTAVSTNRWKRSAVCEVDVSLRSANIFSRIYQEAVTTAFRVGSSTDGNPYNYHNVPNNTDYASVQDWVLDKVHLAGIPAHNLIPDPSFLPEEALRFFYIDENWTEALIDGALSLANHWADKPEDDYCRSALKAALNKYLTTRQDGLGYRPQMPKYGFLLKSQVLARYPDLAVSAEFEPMAFVSEDIDLKPKAPILIQKKLGSDVMLCLFDCSPPELKSLKFSLPPHQQNFTVGEELTLKDLVVSFRKTYSVPSNDKQDKSRVNQHFPNVDDNSEIFDWHWRCMKVDAYATKVFNFCRDNMSKADFFETEATSAMFALQLNEPIYTLDIQVPEQNAVGVVVPEGPFQFHIPEFPTPQVPSLPQPVPVEKCRPTKLERSPAIPRMLAPPVPQHGEQKTLIVFTKGHEHVAAEDPKFVIKVYPINGPSYIPTQLSIKPDLVFSITIDDNLRKNKENYKLTLKSLKVKIMIGDDLSSKAPMKPMLKRGSIQPAPTMLSNLRFNILKSFDGDFLVLDIIPRSFNGVKLGHVTEASFVLGAVDVLPWDKDPKTGKYPKTFVNLIPEYKEIKRPDQPGAELVMKPYWTKVAQHRD